MPIFLGGVASSEPAAGGAAYSVDNSCRFNDNDTAYLARTPAGAGNRKTWTFSAWVKRCNLGSTQYLFSAGTAATNYTAVFFDASDKLNVIRVVSSSTDAQKVTTAVHRDPASWYHVVVKMDAANTNLDVYVNGSEVTVFDTTNEPSNIDGVENNTVLHEIGRRSYTAGGTYFDGYMAEVVLVDGSALAPTSFGEVNANGVWVPKSVSGLTVGTNGFHLDFGDSGDIGNDVSGNGNDFTPSGLAAGDVLIDTPTNNYCTWSPIRSQGGGSPIPYTISNGNNQIVVPASDSIVASMGANSGKWYWEIRVITVAGIDIGACTEDFHTNAEIPYSSPASPSGADAFGYYNSGGWSSTIGGAFLNGTPFASYTNGDIIGIALDIDNNQVSFYKNGVQTSTTKSIAALLGGRSWFPAAGNWSGASSIFANFGADSTFGGAIAAGGNVDGNGHGDFQYAPPTDFLALCTENLPDPDIANPSDHFDVALYTGNGTAIGSGGNEISNLSFQPDFVWIKNRDAADQHILTDAVRGATKYISSDDTDIEATEAETLASFDTDGFTVGNDVQVNTNTEDYVAWCWKAGGSGSSDTNGTISSTVSVNTTAGFSIVKYVGNGTGGATIGHGLGAVPGLIIVKNLDQTDSWAVYHQGVASDPETDYLILDTDAASADLNTIWNDTAPTSTVFSVGTSHLVNASTENYVAYCFSEVEGFSRIGSYTGNGNADGPFVWCGFRPKLVIYKSNGVADWRMFDGARNAYNLVNSAFYPDLPNAESTLTSMDMLSNGFKIRTSASGDNASATNFTFLAFAEHPFAYARAR